uniref:Uncharacterized protein n=1 Tax=Mustela putorius furo TaxID=9669 RepID=M3XZC6_MUSPF
MLCLRLNAGRTEIAFHRAPAERGSRLGGCPFPSSFSAPGNLSLFMNKPGIGKSKARMTPPQCYWGLFFSALRNVEFPSSE